MKRQTDIRTKSMVAASMALMCAFAGGEAAAQARYNPGDRVQCNLVGMNAPQYEKYYEPGTVLAFRPGDGPDGSWYRVKADSNGVEYYCKIEVIRPIAAATTRPTAPTMPPARPRPTNLAAEPMPPTAGSPVGAFLDCPIKQPQARNGSRPNPELLKRIIRCAKGEKAVPPREEGAVQVEVSTLLVGQSRPWSYRQDEGNGQVGTLVFPVKTTYTVRTFYRAATEVEENWIRVLNFYVNPFGEWQIGSEETVKAPITRRIPKS